MPAAAVYTPVRALFISGLALVCAPALAQTTVSSVQFEKSTIVGREGFFGVGRSTDGFWWMIDPDGKPFFYKGVTSVNRAGTMGGRRAKPGPYAAVVDQKYNWPNDKEPFVKSVVQRLREWNFNALGAWTTEEFFDKGLPYTEIIEFFKEGPFVSDSDELDPDAYGATARGIPDVFDPLWQQAADRKAELLCRPRKDSKLLVGYFTDNEIGFAEPRRSGRQADPAAATSPGRPGLLQICLSADEKRSAHQVAWDMVLKKHGTTQKAAAAWGIKDASLEALRRMRADGTAIVSDGFVADNQAFVKLFAGRYFRIAAETIRRHDPNHLILGCRWGSPPANWVLAEQKPWTDIISANNYQDIMYERMDIIWRATQMPILIGEFNWNTDYFRAIGMAGEKPGQFANATERMLHKGRQALERTFAHPGVVGYTFYRWVHGSGGGLVDQQDQPNLRDIPQLKDLNARAEAIRLAAARVDAAPISGIVTISLVGGRGGGERVVVAVDVTDGKWDVSARGASIEGKVLSSRGEAGKVELTLDLMFTSGRFTGPTGKGQYTVSVQRRGIVLEGTFTGTFNGQPVKGPALGFIERP